MIELIKFIVESFAEKKESIIYDVNQDGKNINVVIKLEKDDMGKVIGRQGKIAKALRTLVRAGSAKENVRYNIEIREIGE